MDVQSSETDPLIHRRKHVTNLESQVPSPRKAESKPAHDWREQLSRTLWIIRKRPKDLLEYVPFVKWTSQYRLSWFVRDAIGALTVASLYVPLAVSFASLARAHPLSGFYSFVINPIVYAALGSSPQMVVGPEAPGSLLVGTAVLLAPGTNDGVVSAAIAGSAASFAGALLFAAGFCRIGFLECIVNRAFMRGFISAIGFTVIVEQAIPVLGLSALKAKHQSVSRGSVATKLLFILKNLNHAHTLTAVVSLLSFAVVMVLRIARPSMHPSFIYIPDRFLVVAITAILAWTLDWHQRGLDIIGPIQTSDSPRFRPHWPFQYLDPEYLFDTLAIASAIALLGLFESTLTAKTLKKTAPKILQGIPLSINQELIALGTGNIIGGSFMALPAFGGYGRSKLNVSVGGVTPMSNILLSLITGACLLFFLQAFYYVPRGVLAAMMSIVGVSQIEEAPKDIRFYAKIHGWRELALMAIVFGCTIFHSMFLGIAVGIGLSLLVLIQYSGEVPIGIIDPNAPIDPVVNHHSLPFHEERILIINVRRRLTFANTNHLDDELERLERQVDLRRRPSFDYPGPSNRVRRKNIMFVMRDASSMDACAAQGLTDLVYDRAKEGTRIVFCGAWTADPRSEILKRMKRSGIWDMCGGARNFVVSYEDGLAIFENVEAEH